MEATFRVLRERGFFPSFAVDVGAYEGEWAALFRSFFPECKVLMVEPQRQKQALLKRLVDQSNGALRVSESLLGSEDGVEIDFFEMETGSSVMTELSPYPRVVTKKVTRELDGVVKRYPDWGRPSFLKLDVQGFELEVLAGAQRALQSSDFLLLEVSVRPYNQGAPLLADVVTHLAAKGFVLDDVCSLMRNRGGLLQQADLLFVNEESQFRSLQHLA
jgi:FkbM family methyltransferase